MPRLIKRTTTEVFELEDGEDETDLAARGDEEDEEEEVEDNEEEPGPTPVSHRRRTRS